MNRPRVLATIALAPLVIAGALRFAHDPVAHEASGELIDRAHGYTGSQTCATCHPDHHASWDRTHHSRMTQRPTPEAVLGAFDGRRVDYEGQYATVSRDGDRFVMDVPDPARGTAARRSAEVALTVGSRRYQQYFERVERGDGVAFVRLPLLGWLITKIKHWADMAALWQDKQALFSVRPIRIEDAKREVLMDFEPHIVAYRKMREQKLAETSGNTPD